MGEGIGFAMAKACLLKGAHIAILARNKSKLARAASQLRSVLPENSTQSIVTISADVSDFDALRSAISSSLSSAEWTALDALVCNAGVECVSALSNTAMSEYRRVMDINFFGVVHSLKICLPLLSRPNNEKKCGRVVVTSSLLGLCSMSYYSAYCASKWALRGFVESVFAECAAQNVFVSMVFPPDTKTAQWQREKKVAIPETVRALSEDAGVFEAE